MGFYSDYLAYPTSDRTEMDRSVLAGRHGNVVLTSACPIAGTGLDPRHQMAAVDVFLSRRT